VLSEATDGSAVEAMEFQNYINGKWVNGRSTFQTINPANEELLADIAQADIADVDSAADAALKAYQPGA
jgi:aldehyde dehydrogenase (NAD+)